jgi:uncharacterized ubiquitin-like protein YukD
MSLISVTVKVVGGIRPTRPVTALEVANAVAPYIGKEFNVSVQTSHTPQQLADMVDTLLGVSPGETFDETLIELGDGKILDNKKSLSANGVENGDVLQYRFYVAL